MTTRAREQLEDSAPWQPDSAGDMVDWVLDNLPLVLEAAREAGRAERRTNWGGAGSVWFLIPSRAEPTPPPEKTERDK